MSWVQMLRISRVKEIDDKLMHKIGYPDKLIDELAKVKTICLQRR